MPRWVREATRPPLGPERSWPLLSDLGRQMVVIACKRCNRLGRKRADRLLAELGDLDLPIVAERVAAAGGCERALHPPLVTDLEYNLKCCEARRIVP